MGEERPKRLYICLRCGNKFWSRAKKPQCNVCKSKRVMLWEDFEKLSDAEKAELLPALFKVQKEPEPKGIESEIKELNEAKAGDSERVNGGDRERKRSFIADMLSGEGSLLDAIKAGKEVEEGDHEGVKKGEVVKGERVKLKDVIEEAKDEARKEVKNRKGFMLPGSFRFWLLVGSAFTVYILYKLGMFKEILETLGVWKEKEEKEEKTPVIRSPVLGKIEQNLRSG